jgi:hypothetical protein
MVEDSFTMRVATASPSTVTCAQFPSETSCTGGVSGEGVYRRGWVLAATTPRIIGESPQLNFFLDIICFYVYTSIEYFDEPQS